jgi:glycosyltransferase involved in cell wall biosynthesis/nucleotide-binding universal stress UspA family protein
MTRLDMGRVTVVPIIPGVQAAPLIELASAIAGWRMGRTVILSVVEVPQGRSLSEGASVARRRRELLRRIGGHLDPESVELAVRAARTFDQGVREAVEEVHATHLVLGWRGPLRSDRRLAKSNLDRLITDPPCNLAIFRTRRAGRLTASTATESSAWPPQRILLPIRGGLHADLAMAIGDSLARGFNSDLSVLRIERADGSHDSRESPTPNAHVITVKDESVVDTIALQSERHDLVILGASARGLHSSHLFGRIPEDVADRVACNVLIVKTAEPLSIHMFGLSEKAVHSVSSPNQASISTIVDQWFAENTFHSHEFEDVGELVDLKERQELTISVALPALNEEATIGKILATIKQRLMEDSPLVDELVVIDSNSTDRTTAIARDLGVPVFAHSDILPEHGTYQGKGEGLWKSLHVTKGDIVVWIDSDITDLHPKFVYGLVGPLLTQPRVEFVKGYYRRPLNLGGELLTTGGGRVTELTARPLINFFYPLLSGLVQPLAGEMAGRRQLLEQLPFFTGYGVETGLLIDIVERYGLDAIAQTDLENRIHRNQDMISLSKMAFAIIQVVMRRLEDRQHIRLLEENNTTMKLIHYSPRELFLEVKEIQEYERPPINRIEQYVRRDTSLRESVASR